MPYILYGFLAMQNKGQIVRRYNFLHTLSYYRNILPGLFSLSSIKIDLYQFKNYSIFSIH